MNWTIKNTGVFTKDDNKHTGESVRSFQKFMYMIQTCLDGTFFFGIGGRRWIVVQKRSKALLLEIDVWICQEGSEPCSFPKSLSRSSHGVKLTQMAIDFYFFIKFSKKKRFYQIWKTLYASIIIQIHSLICQIRSCCFSTCMKHENKIMYSYISTHHQICFPYRQSTFNSNLADKTTIPDDM